jgi:hypothetical protein
MLKESGELQFYGCDPEGHRFLMSNLDMENIAERLGEQTGSDGIPVVETNGPILGVDDDSEVDMVNSSITRRKGVLTWRGEEVQIAKWEESI